MSGSHPHSPDSRGRSRRAVLRRFGTRHLLFVEDEQRLYEVDDVTALVWDGLNRGLAPDAIVGELAKAGSDPLGAQRAVEESMRLLGFVVLPDGLE